MRTAAPACRVHVRCLPPLGPLARYSPYLLLKYHCHLNVEVYKYYLKYLYTVPYRTGMLQASGPAMWVAFL